MSTLYPADRLAAEKEDPHENSTLRLIPVPLTLLAMFLGFGITYLHTWTDSFSFSRGDSRTTAPVPRSVNLQEQGRTLFGTHCAACHQAHGNGLPGVFPPLAGSSWVTGRAEVPSAIVLHGIDGEIQVKETTYKGVMPTFKDRLTDEEVAAILSYVRTSWGNQAGPVDPKTVSAVRDSTKDRQRSWSGGTELKEMQWP